jgi:hypothetical protein
VPTTALKVGRKIAAVRANQWRDALSPKGHHMATKERLAAMAGSLCAVCTGVMVIKVVAPDPRDGAMQLRTYVCAECGHSRTYSVDGGES